MVFNIGFSGFWVVLVDLDVIGNNIVNVSIVGFKGSKVQFGDLYVSGFLSVGINFIGDGVWVQDVKQFFGQGNISFIDSGLDMVISGDGFFILNNGGEICYFWVGQFGIDKDGFVINNQSMCVQGFIVDGDGNLLGICGDLQVFMDNLLFCCIINLVFDLNLDFCEFVLEMCVWDIGFLVFIDVFGEIFNVQYIDGMFDYVVDFIVVMIVWEVVVVINDVLGLSVLVMIIVIMFLDDVYIIVVGVSNFVFSFSINGVFLVLDISNIILLQDLVDFINNFSEMFIFVFIVDDGFGINVFWVIYNQGDILCYQYDDDGELSIDSDVDVMVQGDINVIVDWVVVGIVDFVDGDFEIVFNVLLICIINEFNFQDQCIYNYVILIMIYDSLGNFYELI